MKGVFMYYVETYNTMNLPYQLKAKAKVTNLKIPGIFSKKYRVYYILNIPQPTTTTTHLDFSWNSQQNGNTMSMKNSSLLTMLTS